MRKDPLQRKALFGAIGLIICAIVFFTGEFQVASTLVAYAGQFVNLQFFAFHVPAGSLLSLESIAVVLGAFVISKANIFTKSTPLQLKILIGIGCGMISFLILYGSTLMASHHIISLWWIITSFVVLGVGEVSLTPSIFAYIAHVGPAHSKGMLMAGAYFALSLSGYFSTFIGETLLKKFDMHSTSLAFYRANFSVTIGLLLMLAILILLQWLITTNIAREKPRY